MHEDDLASLFERLGYIMTSYARIEAMKAQNEYRRCRDESPEYNHDDFEEQALNIASASQFFRDFRGC